MKTAYDLVVIGGGPAGLAAACAAHEAGVRDILVLERDDRPGGILNQCIHNGFGLHTFREELTGPEYAARYIEKAGAAGIPCLCGTMVIGLTPGRAVTAVSREHGLFTLQAGAVVLAMGCRERPRGALNIPGTRPAGVYTAGTAQRLMNIEGLRVGREVVVLGSGDIGLIMARRMKLEGAEVRAVAELMPYSGGLKRNIVQCLDDFGIPLLLSHTVVEVHGRQRVTGVTLAAVDAQRRPVPGSEKYIPCDTLLLSVGLLPENELSREAGLEIDPVTGGPRVNGRLATSAPGIFACGNVLHVHDLVDYVSQEAALAGRQAAAWLRSPAPTARSIPLRAGHGVRYTVPQSLDALDEPVTIRFRVDTIYRDRYVSLYLDGERLIHRRRRVLAPGEMEQLTLRPEQLAAHPEPAELTVCLEVE